MPLDRPILITGTPRSGKSLVWSLVSRAEEFACDSEPVMRWDTRFTGGANDARGDVDPSGSRRMPTDEEWDRIQSIVQGARRRLGYAGIESVPESRPLF